MKTRIIIPIYHCIDKKTQIMKLDEYSMRRHFEDELKKLRKENE